jgi:hypothetical protein
LRRISDVDAARRGACPVNDADHDPGERQHTVFLFCSAATIWS